MLSFIKRMIPNPLKRRIKRLLKNTLYKSTRKTVLKEYGNNLFNLYKGNFLEDYLIKDKDFEPYLRILFKHIVKKGDTVLDVGANVGIHSLYLSNLVGENGRVYAFEPVSYNLKRLNTNKFLNGAKNLHIVDAAITEKSGKVEIFQFKENDYDLGNNSLVLNEHLSQVESHRLEKKSVPGVTLDDFCDKHTLEVDFIKMDIEGYEYFALKGASKLLKTLPTMVLEYNSTRIDFVGISNSHFKDLLGETYDCYEILKSDDVEDTFSLEPFFFERKFTSDLLCVPKLTSVVEKK